MTGLLGELQEPVQLAGKEALKEEDALLALQIECGSGSSS